MSGKLFVVGTPIGNLGDFSIRAQETLATVDFIAAEDTRVTIKLLNHFGISTPMVSYHEHNLRERGEIIIGRILNGENCAIVTDAGMPAISDPGEDLVRLAHQNSIKIESVPGPTALTTALSMCGLAVGRFCFEGFLTTVKSNRRVHLDELKDEKRTMVFYEAPHKLLNTLKDMLAVFGDREISIIKEITKLHETAESFNLANGLNGEPRGEYVLLVEGGKIENDNLKLSEKEHIDLYISQGMDKKEALKKVAKERGVSKSSLYKYTLGE